MNIAKMNLGLILSTFFAKGGGETALKVFERRKGPPEPNGLYHLLRDHETSDEAITDPETYHRDAFDTLLAGYAMLEIASMCGEIPRNLPRTITAPARFVLKHPAVKAYYVDHYPTPLVEAFRRRLHGRPIAKWNQFDENSRFARFFEHSRPLENDGPLETFLWFLDDGERDWGDGFKDLDDTIRAIKSPRRAAKCLFSEKKDDLVAHSVRGLVEFVEFCTGFDEFLQSFENGRMRLLRSAYWHFHAYWFVQLRDKVGKAVVDRILPAVLAWRDHPELANATTGTDWNRIALEIRAASRNISRLTSRTIYGPPLISEMKTAPSL